MKYTDFKTYLQKSNFYSNYEYSPVEIWKKNNTNFFENPSLLKDFRRNVLSGGTLNPPDRPSKINDNILIYPDCSFPEKIKNLFKLAFRLLKFQTRSIRYHKKFFILKKDKSKFKTRKITFFKSLKDCNIRNSYYSSIVSQYFNDAKVILEIGSGYGHLASLIKNKMKSKICLIDLPENLILANEFLSSLKINTSLKFQPELIDEITLLLPSDIDILHGKVDLVINTMSFQHMSKQQIDEYFTFINSSQPKYLYLVNRNIIRDKTDIIIDDYPISKAFVKIFDKKFQTSYHKEQIWKRRH